MSNYVAQVWWKEKFTSGYANVLYLGNFWADFGYSGVYVSTFILGYIANWLYSLILLISKYEKNWTYTLSISLFMPILTFNFFLFEYNYFILYERNDSVSHVLLFNYVA